MSKRSSKRNATMTNTPKEEVVVVKNDTLNILVSTDRNYLKYLRVLMVSVYENHPDCEVNFYVLHDKLDETDEAYGNEVADMYGQKVYYLKVDASLYDDLPFGGQLWTIETMYRLCAHQILPETLDRILYLDIDIIVDGDLLPYYTMDFEDNFLIASKCRYDIRNENGTLTDFEIKETMNPETARAGGYFNAGVILINLEKFRAENIDVEFYKNVVETVTGNNNILNDQGLLNMAFLTKTKLLKNGHYNYRIDFSLPDYFSERKRFHYDEEMSYQYYPYQPTIIHYCGLIPKNNKPWEWNFDDTEIRAASNRYNDWLPELNAYFGIWWKYAEKVSDYEKMARSVQCRNQAYIVFNRMLGLNRLDVVNKLAVDSLFVPADLGRKNTILQNEDLNSYIIPKVYRCADGATKSTIKNLPESFTLNVGFRLTVKQIAAAPQGATPLIQILEPNLPDVPVYRRYYHGIKANRWGEWQRLATDNDIFMLEAKVQTLLQEPEKEEHEKVSLSLFGPCVIRDIFGVHEDDGGYQINCYEGFINPLAMGSPAVSCDRELLEEKVYALPEKNFLKRNIFLDLTKTYWDYLAENQSDYFMIDVGDIRLPIISDPGGCVASCRVPSTPLMESLSKDGVYKIASRRKAQSYTDDEIQEAMLSFAKKALELYDEEKIILLECIPATEYYGFNHEITPFASGWMVEDCRRCIRVAFDTLRNALPKAHVIPFPKYYIADEHNKWGKHILHFEPSFYDYALKAVNIITSKCENEVQMLNELKEKTELETLEKRVALLSRNEVRFADYYKLESLYVPYNNTIQENADVNDYHEPGAYRCRSGKEKESITNLPESFTQNVGFRLTVKQIAAIVEGGTAIIQTLEPNLPNVPVYRRYYHGMKANKWGPWLRLSTDADLEALTQTSTAQAEQITQLTEQLSAQVQTNTAQAEQITQLNELLSVQVQTNADQAEQITQLNEQLSAQAQTNTEQAEQIAQLNEQLATMQNEMAAQKRLLEALAKVVLR